jgi:hypothetical protein
VALRVEGLDGPGAAHAARIATTDAAPSPEATAHAAGDGRPTAPRPVTPQALKDMPTMTGRQRPTDPGASSAAATSAARSAAPPAPATLHIGRIDITVQAPAAGAPARSPAPVADSAYLSRHYLRRL